CDVSTHQCVQCVANSDCPGPLICDPASHHCVVCTAGDTQNCHADQEGSACLTDGTCGCNDDGDCGPSGSGRICSAALHHCLPGCRVGQDDCPSGETCQGLASGTLGQCVPNGDGGPGDGGPGDGGPGDGSSGDGAGGDQGGSDGGGDGSRGDR